MAGDRGLLRPELTESATRPQAEEIAAIDADAFISANRTCEIGLEQATGEPFESAIQLLERATRAR
jgi:D-lactate dehydrogenase